LGLFLSSVLGNTVANKEIEKGTKKEVINTYQYCNKSVKYQKYATVQPGYHELSEYSKIVHNNRRLTCHLGQKTKKYLNRFEFVSNVIILTKFDCTTKIGTEQFLFKIFEIKFVLFHVILLFKLLSKSRTVTAFMISTECFTDLNHLNLISLEYDDSVFRLEQIYYIAPGAS